MAAGVQMRSDLRRLGEGARADAVSLAKGTAQGLTWTMAKVRRAEIEHLRQVIDRPTRWTLNAPLYKPAKPDELRAEVWLQDTKDQISTEPAKFLEPQIVGGRRRQKRHERALQAIGVLPPGWFTVPGPGARQDRFGNMPGAQYVEILSALKAFSALKRGNTAYNINRTAKSAKRNKRLRNYFAVTGNNRRARNGGALPMGVYEEQANGRIITVLRFRPSVTYSKRVRWFEVGDDVIEKNRDNDINGGIRKALREARGHYARSA